MNVGELGREDFTDAALVFRIQKRPEERDAHGLDALAPEVFDAAVDVVLVQRQPNGSVAQHAFADWDPQPPRYEHRRCWVREVVAVAVLLVAVANLQRVLVAASAEQPDLCSL